jgi:hypothetical protein
MKNTVFAVLAGCLSATATVKTAEAQSHKNRPALFNLKALQAFVSYTDSIYTAPAVVNPLKNIHSKAILSFKKIFPAATNERWFSVGDGFMVKFIDDGTMNRADFDRKGNWLHSIKYYGEEKLLPELRTQVKQLYFDYSITLVTEIYKRSDTAYIIQLETYTALKKIRICNGETELIEDYIKR